MAVSGPKKITLFELKNVNVYLEVKKDDHGETHILLHCYLVNVEFVKVVGLYKVRKLRDWLTWYLAKK